MISVGRHMGMAVACAALVATIGVAPVALADPLNEGGTTVSAPFEQPFSAEDITYTITSASLTPDVDDSVRLDLEIKADVGDVLGGINFWDDGFRLTAGDDTYAPVSGLNETVAEDSTMSGTVSFVVPDTVTAAALVFRFPGDTEQEAPITLDASAIAETGAPGGDGVTVQLNSPFTSGEVTYTITSASAEPTADDSLQLDLELKAAVGDQLGGINFWDSAFRLEVGDESYTPVSGLNETVAENSTMTGTVSFVVPEGTDAATFVITFPDDGEKSVPVTFGTAAVR